jgi:hypothetical protein
MIPDGLDSAHNIKRILTVYSLTTVCILTPACAHNSPHTRPLTVQQHPLPTATERYTTYPISDALGHKGPNLSLAEHKWAEHVAHMTTYRGEIARLRFTKDVHGFKTPLVIYLDKAQPGQPDRGGHVIGEACNVYFDPAIYGISVGTGVECGASAAASGSP